MDAWALEADPVYRRRFLSVTGNQLWLEGDKPHGLDFGYLQDSDSGFMVVDLFHGHAPRYFDTDHLDAAPIQVFRPMLVLDSDIATNVRNYVEGSLTDPIIRSRVEQFLQWFASMPNANVNPAYHLLEAIARSSKETKARDFAIRTASAIMQVEVMDRDVYRSSGRLVRREDARDYLEQLFGTDDIDAISSGQVAGVTRFDDTMVEGFYCLLLKIAIQSAKWPKPSDFLRNVEEWVTWIGTHDVLLSNFEIGAALMQFSRTLKSFLTIKRTWSFEKATNNILHSSWDCLYMRTPHTLLARGGASDATLGFLLTADVQSARVLRLQRFQLMAIPARSYPRPYYELDEHLLELIVPEGALGRAADMIGEMLASRRPRDREPDFKPTIDELHVELRAFLDR